MCCESNKQSKVKFDQKTLGKFILSKAPDWRGILNEVQGNIVDGQLSDDILMATPDTLVSYLKAKRWTDAQEWVFAHAYLSPKQLEIELYWALQPHLTNNGKVIAAMTFGEYTDKIDRGADPFITLLALATELIRDLKEEWL